MKNDWNEGNFSYKLLLNSCNQSVICAFSYMLTSNSTEINREQRFHVESCYWTLSYKL